MDVWLLAAQLVVGGGATPSAGLIGSWEAEIQSPSALQRDRYQSQQAAFPDPEPKNNSTMAIAASAPGAGAPSMAEAVNGWPSPSQVMPPSRHPSPPLGSADLKPVTGSQLYQFRSAALEAGELYAQAVPQRYLSRWQRAFTTPTYSEWQRLLAAEAATMARRQDQSPLAVLVGDSLALWLPVDDLPPDQLWLNQSISGETTAHMLQRLHYFAGTRPQTIHLMAGINDLKTGMPEAELLDNVY
ncbi:MAG: G-D-S-L family lipolytic protein, partial [Nodosilinea sp.]